MLALHDIERATLALVVQQQDGGYLDALHSGCFEAQTNRSIFEALRDLHEAGRPFDEPSLLAQLERRQALADAGGRAGVTALYYHDTALPAAADRYLVDLQRAAQRRELARTLAGLSRLAGDASEERSLDDLLEQVEAECSRLRRSQLDRLDLTAAAMVEGAMDLYERATKGNMGVESGLREIDEMIGGWEPGTLTVLMGSPGIGKTALWLQSALHVAASRPVALVQLEMTPGKMGLRALANIARVDFGALRRGRELPSPELLRLTDALGQVSERRVLLAPDGVDEWPQIKAFYRRAVRDHGARVLFLDNLKIVGVPRVRTDLERFTLLTRELKLLARSLDVPVVAIHHMHRTEREGQRPSLTSGYGSSSIEQDADNVLALWRPSEDLEDEVELLPLKTRDDRARSATVRWVGRQQRYESLRPPPSQPDRLY